MATAVEEIKKLQRSAEDRERDYFTIDEFMLVRENLPDLKLELIRGELVVKPEQGRDYFTIPEFEIVADLFPDHRLELINGEIVMSPPPDRRHQQHAGQLLDLFSEYHKRIKAAGCGIGGANYFYEVPDEVAERLVAAGLGNPSDVCPDASISFKKYHHTGRIPPALLVVEVLSDSRRGHVFRDMTTKPEIYAALEIPTYWIVDRRDQSVLVHTQPSGSAYALRQQFKGDAILPAPGLDFLQITPAQIFED
ncbi:MAG: Uma2 family endonuclease [Acidobacteriota bacterium]